MKRIGIVVALASEAACLTRAAPTPDSPLQLDERFSLVLCGSGAERARRGADVLLDAGAEALLSFGVAGALSEAVRPGHLLLPRAVVGAGRRYDVHSEWHRRVKRRLDAAARGAHGGTLAAAERVLANAADKAALRRASGAEAVDMESAAIIECADRRGVPALVLRAALDAAHSEVPAAVVRRADPYGRVDVLPLLADLARRPSALPQFVEIVLAYRAATGTLRWLARNRALVLADAPGP